jgi:putative sterol carrier protein
MAEIDRNSTPEEVRDFMETCPREQRLTIGRKLRPKQLIEGVFPWFLNRKPANAEKLAGQTGAFRFEIEGDRGGVWAIELANGRFSVRAGEPANPDFGAALHIDDFEDIVRGDLDPGKAFLKGKVRTQGDMGVPMRIGMLLYGDKVKKFLR